MSKSSQFTRELAIVELDQLAGAISRLFDTINSEFPEGYLRQYHTLDLQRALVLVKTARLACKTGWYIC